MVHACVNAFRCAVRLWSSCCPTLRSVIASLALAASSSPEETADSSLSSKMPVEPSPESAVARFRFLFSLEALALPALPVRLFGCPAQKALMSSSAVGMVVRCSR